MQVLSYKFNEIKLNYIEKMVYRFFFNLKKYINFNNINFKSKLFEILILLQSSTL